MSEREECEKKRERVSVLERRKKDLSAAVA